jgi:hypothetical protein
LATPLVALRQGTITDNVGIYNYSLAGVFVPLRNRVAVADMVGILIEF